jgi:tetratricopeptide (TPR) repeat protein
MLAIFFAIALSVIIYSNSLDGPFVFDDQQILTNPYLRLSELSLEGLKKAGSESPNSARMVPNISFALDYYFHRFQVRYYRITNLVIHLATGLLLYLLVTTTLRLPSLRKQYPRYHEIAFFTVLIWLVHPLGVQSVAYIVQRMNSLAALFYILALLLYVYGRMATTWRKKFVLFAGTTVSALLALGSKQNAATLPVFIFFYEWYFFQDMSRVWLKKHFFWPLGLLGVFLGVTIFFLGTDPLARIIGGYTSRDFTLGERLLTELRVVVHYFTLIVFPNPSRLSLNYDFPLSHSPVNPLATLFSLGVIMGLLGLTWFTAKKHRLVSFCLLWFLGNLVIESSVISLEIIFEHRTYLPSMGILLMGVILIYRHIKVPWQRLVPLVVIVAVFSLWTHERSGIWAGEIKLWSDIVEKHPTLARGHLGLGVSWKRQGEQDKAFESYKRAIAADPEYADAYNNLGVIYEERGQLKKAMENYQKAYLFNKSNFLALNNIASIYTAKKDFTRALETYQQSLDIHSRYVDTYKGIALTYRAMNDREKFDEFLKKARALENPSGQ